MPTLSIKNLKAEIDKKPVLCGISLKVRAGEIHALMGPNGSGKSTLAHVISGNPKFKITGGSISWGKRKISGIGPDKIARLGILMAFQSPQSVPGVSVSNLLRIAGAQAKKNSGFKDHAKKIGKAARKLRFPPEFLSRSLNQGFSGGESKKMEMLQLSMLDPKLALVDEIDSGLDINALRLVSSGLNALAERGAGMLIITHYNRILKYVKPDFVHIMQSGKIVESGTKKLAEKVEKLGFEKSDYK